MFEMEIENPFVVKQYIFSHHKSRIRIATFVPPRSESSLLCAPIPWDNFSISDLQGCFSISSRHQIRFVLRCPGQIKTWNLVEMTSVWGKREAMAFIPQKQYLQ
jgi:hypothetical protein